MDDSKIIMFENRLTKNFKHLNKQAKRLGVTCYRIYDHDLPEFPICVEIYGPYVYVAEYKRRHQLSDDEYQLWMDESLNSIVKIVAVPLENIFYKLRQKKQGRLGQYLKLENIKKELVVEENGMKFIVNLSDYLDTGLFLDHRNTREKVKSISKNKNVLNLFAYTGSFSVYAASGGAQEVVTVDLSNTYLQWAKKNMELNGFENESNYKFVQADVLQYLDSLDNECFDIIILDPPTFSNSKKMNDILDIQRDHVSLINRCLKILKKGGLLFFSNNYKKFVLEQEKIHSNEIKDMTLQTVPFDFVGRCTRFSYQIKKAD